MTESGGETFNLEIRLDLELLSYQLLVMARVLHRASAVSRGGERENEPLRRASRKRIGVGKFAPPSYALRVVASLGRKVGQEFDSSLILQSQSRSLCVYPRLKLAAVGKIKSVQERPLVMADRRGPLTGANRFLELPYVGVDEFRI
jgi:hypothetical protein